MNKNVKRLTFGAMITALVGVLLVINRQTAGFLETYMIWLVPLPMIAYVSIYGAKNGLVVAAAIILLSLVLSTSTSIFYVAGSVLLGLVYGYFLRKGKSGLFLYFVATAGSFVVTFVTMVVFAKFFGYDMDSDLELMKQILSQAGTSMPTGWSFKMILYAGMVLSCFIEGAVIHFLTRLVMKRLKIKMPPMKPMRSWQMPKWIPIVTGILMAGYIALYRLYPNERYSEYVAIAAMPGVFICLLFGYITIVTFCAAQGFRWAVLLVVVLLFIAPMVTMPVLIVLGVVDCYHPLRANMT